MATNTQSTPAVEVTEVVEKENVSNAEGNKRVRRIRMNLRLLPVCKEAAELYQDHKHYHEGDSGLDLFVVEDVEIKAQQTALLPLGVKAAAWQDGRNVSFLIMPRSSIAKTPLRLANSVGLIDAGYRGELMAAVDNIRNEDYTVKRGDRLVQAVSFNGLGVQYELVEELDATSRGEGGFGSTGK